MNEMAYMITVDDKHIGETPAIAHALGGFGFVVDRVVAMAGAIRAFGDPAAADAVRRLEGVADVSPECVIELPRMHEKIPS